ncbi:MULTISPECIES: hypothetical protein [Paenibacillus]|uniref:hypothetical protein n=1 Tax=Paenibacillus TaxID=44249 RepID=UPI002FE1DB11
MDGRARFKEKLSADRVLEINIGMTHPVTLTQEETDTVIEMIQAAELSPFEPGNAYGASNTGDFVQRSYEGETFVFWTIRWHRIASGTIREKVCDHKREFNKMVSYKSF